MNSKSFRKHGNVKASHISKRKFDKNIWISIASPVEHLESRMLLSVNTSDLLGPRSVVGNQWTYSTSAPGSASSTLIETVIGPTTFMGQSATEVDSGSASKPNALKSYDGQDGTGDYVSFGSVLTGPSRTQQDVYSPYQGFIPQVVIGGMPYTTNDTDTITDTTTGTGANPQISTDMETDVITLVSETPTTLTVTAGTYSVYDFHEVQTIVTPNGDGTNSTSTTTTDSYLAPNVGLVQNVTVGGGTVSLVSFTNSEGKLAFIQPPSDTAEGDKIQPPVTVQIQNNAGVPQTDKSGSITVSIASGTAAGKLTGTLTESAVSGLATFPNLSIDAAGTYTLTAVDNATPPVAPGFSSSFKITGGKLVFIPKLPTSGNAGNPLAPTIRVELVDGKGKVVTTDSSSIVTLSPINLTQGFPITGNVATLVNGMASFSNVVLTTPGSYQLQAADGGDATAQTGTIKIGGLHLAFKRKPSDTSVGVPISYQVQLLDSHNKPVTTGDEASDTIFESATPSKGFVGTPEALGLTNGTYSTSPSVAPEFDAAGTYTLTVEALTLDDVGNPIPDPAVASIISKPFKVLGLHLAFKRKPSDTSVGVPISYQVQLLDSHNKPVTTGDEASDTIFESATPSKGFVGTPETLGLTNGTYSTSPSVAPEFDAAGTYTLTVEALTLDDVGNPIPDPAVASIISKPFKVLGLHLAFKRKPSDTSVGVPISYQVQLLDSHNKPVTTGDKASDTIFESATPSKGFVGTPEALGLTDGTYSTSPSVAPEFDAAGTYTLTVEALTLDDVGNPIPDPAVASIISKPFKVLGLHLAFKRKPSDTSVGVPISYQVQLLDSHNKPVTTGDEASDTIFESATPSKGFVGTPETLGLTNGTYSTSPSVAPEFDAAGTYTLTVEALTLDNVGNPIPDPAVASIISKPFKVL